MKKQEKISIAQKDTKSLEALLLQKEKELTKARSESVLGKQKNVHLVKTMQDNIARIKTWIKEKEINKGVQSQ